MHCSIFNLRSAILPCRAAYLFCCTALAGLLGALAPRAEAAPKQMQITFVGYTNRSEAPTNGLTGPGNIDADPLFVNAATNDFLLQTRGTLFPCIDTGTNLAWMATGTDLDGNPQILGKKPDMGAYETYVPPSGSMLILW